MIAGRFLTLFFSVLAAVAVANANTVNVRADDPCAAIGNKKWVAPADVRACFKSFPVDPAIKSNIIEVVNKTLAFHTSVNYQKLAPAPFTLDVHEDVLKDIARISNQKYDSDFDLHIDLSRSVKRLNDGHCVYINYCYDSLFVSYLPTPLVLLTDKFGIQTVHIAPEAFKVASAEFPDEIQTWQDALPGALKGQLESLSGAKVLGINGLDPLFAVNQNAAISGSYQGLAQRQNGYFASYQAGTAGWTYLMGQFAQQALPLTDTVKLTIVRVNSTKIETLPYRSRFGSTAVPFTDSASFRQKNCVAHAGTNGVSYYDSAAVKRDEVFEVPPNPTAKFRQAPMPSAQEERKHLMNVMLDDTPQQNIFYMLDDKKTGVLALGSFSGDSYSALLTNLLKGLQNLKDQGATQLIVDISNNGGGYICVAHWLHRIIVGPKSTSEPQAGLDTATRAGPLAQEIVKNIADGADPNHLLLYNSGSWAFANDSAMPFDYDWLASPVEKVINGRQDAFSQRLGQECQPFDYDPPAEALFDPKNVAIVGNGRCASSCSLFTVTMAKEEGAKTVVYGGYNIAPQQYCGTVGGQSTDFSTIDSEIKSVGLKNHTLAPPDFVTNSVQGITWRLGFGVDKTNEPEEWQNHHANVNLHLSPEIVSNPTAIWKLIAETVL
ncbi:hypothetical protein C8Q80DRAFT_1265903 [Daedaleopsis nitida]|nr:hypothetical protein C8Q80DRAFT_1265903 [Daedaleopsis nitida]